ncbi:nicotinamide riboside transporter PnuC [Flavobacterium sp. NRK F7]|uniref:nicotinamide riboside transporter PnuC n=1 Tax=Flavobacterium sp. NRK F7 TaxID=2954930 RepID=UPI00209117E4|nr:nicotinamide riboside transporter PnuC [Flavobacterium sp. NRK F7]MCO6161410.1 nicotinamide riboside transporter PnuC [Flavobacterium sp. NRK F7]
MIDFLFSQYKEVSTQNIILEFIAFVFGLVSVFYAKKRNVLVYPTGLVATIISVYLLYEANYFGDMTMNFYYSIMSIYGWIIWSNTSENKVVSISKINFKEKIIGIILFLLTLVFTYLIYQFFEYEIELLNYIDILTSGIFFTAMWYMAKKKIENWTLWIIGDIITVPLYAYRGLGMLALQYLIFTIIAIYAYKEWKKNLVN